MAKETIGQRVVRRARELHKWSAAELARQVGVSPETVRKWTTLETAPNRNRKLLLAEKLQTTLEWLDYGDKPEGASSQQPDEAELILAFRAMPTESPARQRAVAYVRGLADAMAEPTPPEERVRIPITRAETPLDITYVVGPHTATRKAGSQKRKERKE